jgi:CHAD domain-containing protein
MPQPVITLLRHALDLKAAMAECLDDPKPKPVHHLRSSTRRIEAVLELLTATADLPQAPKRTKQLRQAIRKIRRAAGAVRDLDVHRDILAHYKAVDDAIKLDKDLTAKRERAATKLQQRILDDQHEIRRALERLETTLASAADLNLSGSALADNAQSWLANTIKGLDPHHDDQLHTIRKACKTARYIAEIGGETSKSAARLAKRLNEIQQTTGDWHDYLLLLDRANRHLPVDSLLIKKIHEKTGKLRQQAESKASRLATV